MSALTHARSHRQLACLALACAALLAGPAAWGEGAITNVRAAQRASQGVAASQPPMPMWCQ
ncbi:MAG: hypothetical protein NTW21_35600 [Verrucomicrobia bacterium]|nr:hypothetical protein [Verrucomicrobiota bacterium]